MKIGLAIIAVVSVAVAGAFYLNRNAFVPIASMGINCARYLKAPITHSLQLNNKTRRGLGANGSPLVATYGFGRLAGDDFKKIGIEPAAAA